MSCREADLLLVVGDIDSLAELDPERTLLPLLAPDQQKWVLASRRPEDRLRRMLVRLLLAEGLKELEGAPLVETLGRIGRTEQGQPILEQVANESREGGALSRTLSRQRGTVFSTQSRIAMAGRAWNISFSHAGDMGVCLVGRPERTGRVGVDVEQRQDIVLDDVAAAFTPGERAYIERVGGDALWRLWTAKEAVLKLLGTGFLADPQGLEILPPWRVASLPGLSLRHVELPGDSKYVLAVAAEYPPASFQVIAPSLNASRLA